MEFASGNGISRLFALTTTSQVFFHKCGFQTIDLASVPQLICGLTEFSESCCSSAFVMKRDLTGAV
jgi:N-acetylglutamate synthase-like GNAT family acetyltransferase